MAGFDLPVRAIREQMASALDLIVHLTRLRDGTRRITHITEVQGMEGDVITLQDIFLFDYGMGVDEHGRFHGHLKATGVRPKFAEKLADLGIRLGPEVFQPEGFATAGGGHPMKIALSPRFTLALLFAARLAPWRRRSAADARSTDPPRRHHRLPRGQGRRRCPPSPGRRGRLHGAGGRQAGHGADAACARPMPAPGGVVLVVDTSGSMDQDGELDERQGRGSRDVRRQQLPDDQIAIVALQRQRPV